MQSIASEIASLGLPKVAQIGFVVRDRAEWMRRMDPLFGPFTTMDTRVPAAQYRGGVADCELKLAFGQSGDVQIEFIEWVAGDCPHREFIEQGREGMHHLMFYVADVDGWIARLVPLGYQVVWYKRWSPEIVFVYLERPGDPTIIEFLSEAQRAG